MLDSLKSAIGIPMIALLSAGTWLDASEPVSVFVGPLVRDGFVDADKGIIDSTEDIQKELNKTRLSSWPITQIRLRSRSTF